MLLQLREQNTLLYFGTKGGWESHQRSLGPDFVAAGGLTIVHHLHIPDYLPTERELQLNSMHRAKRQ